MRLATLLGLCALSTSALAQVPESFQFCGTEAPRWGGMTKPAQPAVRPAPAGGSCTTGTAHADFTVGDVAARVFNTGALFYEEGIGGTQAQYVVPRASGHSPVYAASVWVGGRAGGEVRTAMATYGDVDFWPGPLGDDGLPVDPDDCSAFDRIYSVSRADIAAVEAGASVADVLEWPAGLGAPVVDGDGIADNYDFASGDRPDIVGDQGLFWIMNDAGGDHGPNGTSPIGLEVRVLAFAYDRPGALGQATFYRYTLVNKGGPDLMDAYVSFFADPDLNFGSYDYVGSDPDLGMGYVYSALDTIQTYGIPPAIGFDVLRGPVADGGTDRLGTTAAWAPLYNPRGCSPWPGDLNTGVDFYESMQGLWSDGSAMRALGDGYNQPETAPVTTFMYSGDPVTGQGWTEGNPGPDLASHESGDRRLTVSTGPFTLAVGEPQEVVFGIVFAQGTSRLHSVEALRDADRLAQQTIDAAFATTAEPAPVRASALRAAPNPFGAETRIAGVSGERVRAVLFDALGRQTRIVHDGPLSGDLRVSGAGLVPGVYVLRIQSSTEAQTLRLVRR